ncbi:MAG: immunoglobulin domain-containing protein [Phycisphaerales bacterium]|nr:immunoglobulin domain-containing protein [Phycisphaerales bacterium]
MSFDRDYRFMTALNTAGNGPGAPAASLAQGFTRLLEVGSAVAGLTGVTIAGFDASPVVNSTPTNTVAAVVTLAGAGVTPSNSRAVYVSAGLFSPIVARAGDPAPETGPGVVLADFAPVIPAAEVSGPRLLIRARLAGPGVTAENDEALFAAVYKQRSTTLVMIVREGDAYTVRPGDVRTVAAIWPTLGWNDEPGDVEGQPWNGRGCAINNGGQLLTRLTFTDGTQAIAWSDLNCFTGPVVGSPPQSLSVNERATVTLTADVRRIVGGGISWRRNGAVVTGSTRISGLGTTSLTIRDVMESDEGTYTLSFETCAASGPLTQATVATLTVNPCPPDVDGDGTRTVADIFAFLGFWFAGDVRGDFNGDQSIGVADIFAFLGAWFAGCA